MRSLPALILGAAVHPDGPSPALRRRTHHAAALWQAGLVTHLVPCGGLGRHPPAEGEAMRRLLEDWGVDPGAILPETASTTTAENIRLALPILDGIGAARAVIVTDPWHAPRALLVARRHGLDARADCPPPAAVGLSSRLRTGLRERSAYLAYLLHLRGR